MGLPSGEIVARPMLPRSCGCLQEFQHYTVDRYRAQRQAKFQSTRCPKCAAKVVEEQQKLAPPAKGEAFAMLPNGAQITLNRVADGSWTGTLAGDGKTVEATAHGPQALTVNLARLWLSGRAADKAVK